MATRFEQAAKKLGATLLPPWEDGSQVFDFGWCWIRLAPELARWDLMDIVTRLEEEMQYATELGGPLDGP